MKLSPTNDTPSIPNWKPPGLGTFVGDSHEWGFPFGHGVDMNPIVLRHNNRMRKFVYVGGRYYRNTKIVWEKHHPDDPLLVGEVIHHLDGDTLNDDISNLQKMTRAEHARLHASGRKHSAETIEKFRKKVFSEKHKENLRIAQTGKRHSETTLEKIRKKVRKARAEGRMYTPKPSWDVEKAIEMRKNHMSYLTIGRHFGVSDSAISKLFKRRGISL